MILVSPFGLTPYIHYSCSSFKNRSQTSARTTRLAIAAWHQANAAAAGFCKSEDGVSQQTAGVEAQSQIKVLTADWDMLRWEITQ